MAKLLSPSNSQEIIDLTASSLKSSSDPVIASEGQSSLPIASTSRTSNDGRVAQASSSKGKRKATEQELEAERIKSMKRSDQTRHMIKTLGHASNPITNSDLYLRTPHVVSCATGHQVSNSGGGGAGQADYWKERTRKMREQLAPTETGLLHGCTIYLNGMVGFQYSDLQIKGLISKHGGLVSAHATSACTHIIAEGGLSGTKAQKVIDQFGSRGSGRRAKMVKLAWLLDSIEKGKKQPEIRYAVVSDPTQHSLIGMFSKQSKKYDI